MEKNGDVGKLGIRFRTDRVRGQEELRACTFHIDKQRLSGAWRGRAEGEGPSHGSPVVGRRWGLQCCFFPRVSVFLAEAAAPRGYRKISYKWRRGRRCAWNLGEPQDD